MSLEAAAARGTLGQLWLEAAIADQDDLRVVNCSVNNHLEDIEYFGPLIALINQSQHSNSIIAFEAKYVLAPTEPEFSINALNMRLRRLAAGFNAGYLCAPKEIQVDVTPPSISPHFNLCRAERDGSRLIVGRTNVTETTGTVRANIEISGKIGDEEELIGAAKTIKIQKVTHVSIFPDIASAQTFGALNTVFIYDRKVARRLRKEERKFWKTAVPLE